MSEVTVRACPVCNERTPHEPRRVRQLTSLGILLALFFVSLRLLARRAWLPGGGLLALSSILFLRWKERRWLYIDCLRCREREERRYRSEKPRLSKIEWF